MRTIRFFATLACAATLASGATAATVLSDDFSGDSPALGVATLPNFTVTGTVDVVAANNPYGIVTPKTVIDLDGSPGPGELTTSSFAFAAGDKVKLTFVLGGAQRGSVSDEFYAGFTAAGTVPFRDYSIGGAFGTYDVFPTGSFGSISTSSSIIGTSPFTTYSLSVIALHAGSLTANVGTTSADSVGPLLSSVTLDISPSGITVPEPATWAMLVAGFGLVGVAVRRRGFAAA